MNQGFFDLGTGADLSTKQVASGKIGCDSCGMHHDCDTPKFKKKIIGKAELPKILIVLENPSQAEDEKGIPLSGDSGSYLRSLLKDNLSEEEYNEIIVTYAVRCAGKVSDKSIADCSQQLRKDIHNLEPSVIIPMGTVAVKAVLGDYISGRLSGIQYDSYYGEIIPAKKYRICPTFPHWMVFAQKDKDINYEKAFISHIQKACSLFDRKVFDFDAYFKKQYDIECLKDEKEIKKALKYFSEQEVVAFDYETTGIKPHGASHRLVSCSIADDKRAVAFPVSEEISEELRSFLKSEVKKVSHNLAFEDAWSWYKLGVQVEKWYWDTMIGCHCIHNKKPTGLKFAIFSKFGITYDSEVDKYLSSSEEENSEKGANGLNKILLAPLDELLYYNALDSLYTFQLYLFQKREFEERSYLKQGFDFFMKGVQALAQVQRNGIRLDSDLLKKQDKELTGLIDRKFEEIMDSFEVKLWKNKQKFNPDSNTDLDILLYKMLGNKRPKSEPCEEKALLKIGGEFCSNILQYRKWKKTRDTYLGQFKREVCNDYVYPFFSLHLVTSFRSCVSKGSLILKYGDSEKNPDGVPIEQIKAGDYVYSYNDELKLVLKKVLWAGKTGHRKVVRVYWSSGVGGKGFLDVTPEHRIRLISGEYVQAKDLIQDYRDKSDPKWKKQPKCRVLSCHRYGDRLWVTNSQAVLEHRLVYETFSGEILSDSDVIHHKDGNHLYHDFSNLEKTDKSNHPRIHYPKTIGSLKSRLKNIEVIKRNHAEGKYDHTYKRGFDHANALQFSKEECLELIHKAGGNITKVPYDFSCFKNLCIIRGIDLREVAFYYNSEGLYLSEDLVWETLQKEGFSRTVSILKVNYYKLEKLCKIYGISYERSFKNQNGFLRPAIATKHNHAITKIEYLDEEVDVYDLEVEDTHNFIANEICVHNSSSNPNFQNIPKRDKEAKKRVRSLLKPHPGCRLVEYDYRGVEVSVGIGYHKDKNMIKYVSDQKNDMHRDTAGDICLKDPKDISKDERQLGKNGFVFPAFYGSTFRSMAPAIWEEIEKMPDLLTHLKSEGIKTFEKFEKHIEKVEKIFWGERFAQYNAWKQRIWKEYQNKGRLRSFTGFEYQMPMKFTEATNYCIQGSAFHCLLYTLIHVQEELQKGKCPKSCIMGQIHDSLVCSIHPEDAEEFDEMVKRIGTKQIQKEFDWLVVPLVIEKEQGSIDGDWTTLEEVKIW